MEINTWSFGLGKGNSDILFYSEVLSSFTLTFSCDFSFNQISGKRDPIEVRVSSLSPTSVYR